VTWLISTPARAAPHQVCLYLDIGAELWDASPRHADGRDFHEEYGRNEGPLSYPAQRWLARVSDETTGETFFGWDPLDENGCAAFELSGATDLTVQWMRWAVWSETGNHVVAYSCPSSTQDCTAGQRTQILPADTTSGVTSVVAQANSLQVKSMDATMWSASFAEERLASMGEQPLTNTRVYLGRDFGNFLHDWTQADRTFGNQPSVLIDKESWRSKFTVAHEYGHTQTMIALQPTFAKTDLNYCYDACDHWMISYEWQAAASMEGIANWYSVSVWNDVDLVECDACEIDVYYVNPSGPASASEHRVPRITPRCTEPGSPPCPPGVGNEWDWMSAFRIFRLTAPTLPSFRTMLTMLSAAYDEGGWTPSSPDAAFWTNFDQAMVDHLGTNYDSWRAAAAQMELDR
jgi:hypothetical protein